MAYLVRQLAQLSKVSVRTLHFYDQIGLLRPARVADNGYRWYEKEQLLRLQQVLFFRELGFELKDIKRILDRRGFDKVRALRTHREVLLKEAGRRRELVRTIDRTLRLLTGGGDMSDREMFAGFDPARQAEYERYLKNRFGGHPAFAESRRKVKGWTKADWQASGEEFGGICRDLAELKGKGLAAGSPEVQAVVARHHRWLKRFWTPDRASYAGLGALYTELEWKKAFEPYDQEHPRLARFLAESMRLYAERELA